MDQIKEYHDPDYPEGAVRVKQEPPSLSEEEKVEKIKCIIHREFMSEIDARQAEVMTIDQRMASSRRLLHRLRYSLVNSYYCDQKLQLTSAQIQDEIAAQRDPRAKAEVSSQLRDGQRNIHPSVRKLLGKETVDINEILRTRGPRNKTRKDYTAMLQKRNYTISADTTKSLRPEDEPSPSQMVPKAPSQAAPKVPSQAAPKVQSQTAPKKIPRHLDPKPTNVLTLDEATRNQMKHRYRIIIGNTSKYVPAASRLDRSTHKWLLYIRGPPRAPDPSPLLRGAVVTLHHSYAPHHIVHLDKHPFHISRRGWGEFPAKIELQFSLPARNKPATVEHNIKLDRKYTGLQTLGSETIVDVWLYSTPEMLEFEYIEDNHTLDTNIQTDEHTDPPDVKQEIPEMDLQTEIQTDIQPDMEEIQTDWMDFFKTPTEMDVDEMFIKPSKAEIKQIVEPEVPEIEPEVNETTEINSILEVPNEILNQPVSFKKRIVKYIDPITGKIYYLEMDRELDLTKVQEIIINNTATKISPIKSNGLKNVRKKKGVSLLKPEVKNQLKTENSNKVLLKQSFPHLENDHCYLSSPKTEVEVKKELNLLDYLSTTIKRFSDIKMAVNFLIKRIPLISDEIRDPDFQKNFPFVVENSEKYWKLDYAKRRNIEWSRAKLINKLLTEHYKGSIWRTKQILLYIRMHGHHPLRIEPTIQTWSYESTIKEIYPHSSNITSLSKFKFDFDTTYEVLELSDDDDVDVLTPDVTVKVKKEVGMTAGLEVLPVDGENRLNYLFVERKCADIGMELRNEDVGHGYSYSAVHAVLLSAMKSFAEEVLRSSLAEKRKEECHLTPPSVWKGTTSTPSLVGLHHVYKAIQNGRLKLLSNTDCATNSTEYYAI